MIEIDGNIVSEDVLTTPFMCNPALCKGACCVEGNAGAPLEESEIETLEECFEQYRPYMTSEGLAAVDRDGFFTVDRDGELTTPLVGDAECAYSFNEGGVTKCAIEQAFLDGKCAFRKPISCHLYPIRLVHFSNGNVGLNIHRWDVCRSAVECGRQLGVPAYKMLREAIQRRFGNEFYEALEAADEYLKNH